MNLDIAVQFEKINLGNDLYAFKPMGIVRGKYDEEMGQFETEFGTYFDSITSELPDSEGYFGYPTNIKELKQIFNGEVSEDYLISEYFDMCQDNAYLGIYDYNTGLIKVVQIPQKTIENIEEEEFDEEKIEAEIKFSIDGLTNLRNFSTLEEIREELDKLIEAAKNLEDAHKEESETFETQKYVVDLEISKKMTLGKLRKKVLGVVINQDKAVNDVTRTIMINETSKNPNHKSHILVAGPSGTGKTKMIDIIAKEMDLPYFKADATAYTKEGYVGKSVYSMLEGLINAADGDVEKAQRGLLIIDEIDKKMSGRTDDVSGKDVLHSLLKIMDRDVIELDVGSSMAPKTVLFDTSNLTIIFMGAFEDLYKARKIDNKPAIGFSQQEKKEEKENFVVSRQELINYGVPAEFLGRIGLVTFTDKLSVKDLVNILNKSKESPLKEEKEYFKDLGITITFSKGFKEEIAKKAVKANTGARNLRSEVKESLQYAYDDVLNDKKIKKLRMTKDTALNPKKYYTE